MLELVLPQILLNEGSEERPDKRKAAYNDKEEDCIVLCFVHKGQQDEAEHEAESLADREEIPRHWSLVDRKGDLRAIDHKVGRDGVVVEAEDDRQHDQLPGCLELVGKT